MLLTPLLTRPWQSLRLRVSVFTLSMVLLVVWSLSFYASRTLRQEMQTQLSNRQYFTVSLLADEINQQIGDRMQALEAAAAAITPSLLRDPAALQHFLAQRELLQGYFGGGSFVTGTDGIALASLPITASRVGISFLDRDYIATALKLGEFAIGRPVMGRGLPVPGFGMAAPIRDAGGRVIGSLTGVTDLSQANFLQRITASRNGHTGSYVLISKQHRVIIMASDPTRVLEQLPPPGRNPTIDSAFEGAEGSVMMRNVQGVPVLASVKGIPAPGWIFAALLPTDEAFAPIATVERRILQATVLATVLAGLLTWWFLRRQFSPLLNASKTLANTTNPPSYLPIERQDEIGTLISGFNQLLRKLALREQLLQESQERLHTLIEGTREAILVHRDERIIYLNPAAQKLLGATSAQELTGYPIAKLVHPDFLALVRQRVQTLYCFGTQNAVSEQRYIQLDGTAIDVEVQGSVIEFDGAPAIQVTLRDITEQNRAQQQLRIAAVAFECQEAMLVLDADWKILRANLAFARITGYSEQDVRGQTTALLHSPRQPTTGEATVWSEVQRCGSIQGERWHTRKDGTDYLARGSATAVRDEQNVVTHYVISFIDATALQREEEQRRLDEAIHRNALVREVHHRIKNNLQGVIGMLRRSAIKHPDLATPLQQAITQVHAISVTYGLQGRTISSPVLLDELIGAIAQENQNLWQTPVRLELCADRSAYAIAEDEAVPTALVLNELILNAIKHGMLAQDPVEITLQPGDVDGTLQVRICNTGYFPPEAQRAGTRHSGLQLVAALMPRNGASILRMQRGDQVLTMLVLAPPVVFPVKKELRRELESRALRA